MNESSSLTSRKMAPIKITIIEGDSSDLLPVVVLLTRTTTSPMPTGRWRQAGPEDLGFLRDLLETLAREGGEGEKTPATPPEGRQGFAPGDDPFEDN
jgi:hypothetical protein